eukprot:6783761-Pyramimonas_sp.AAC.1
MANEDFEELRRRMRLAKLRITPPAWSFPVGIWRLMFHPGECKYSNGEVRKQCENVEDRYFPNVVKCLVWLCTAIRMHAETPLRWHQSQAFSLDKLNGK